MLRLREPIGTFWTQLTENQTNVIIKACQDAHFTDFGAGTGTLAQLLLNHGAKHGTLVEYKALPQRTGPNWSLVTETFATLTNLPPLPNPEIAIISWPINRDTAMLPLVHLLDQFPQIIYAGTNKYPTQTGTPTLWAYLTKHAIVTSVAGTGGTVIHYRKPLLTERRRKLLAEEKAGLK